MPDKLPTVSIGIAAYNEEENIAKLLNALIRQNEHEFILKEIIVISDGSTDDTVMRIGTILDHKITVIDSKVRVGQALRQNEIIKRYSGDILILLNADIIVDNNEFIVKMITPILENEGIGIVAARVKPLQAAGFFESVINVSVSMKQEMYQKINNANNIYMCHGRARAFNKKFADILRFPAAPGEDAYSYIMCVESGFEFYYEGDAIVYYRSPNNLRDHLRQSKRFIKSRSMLTSLPKSNARNYYKIPISLFLFTLVKYVLKKPFHLFVYLGIYFIAQLSSLWYQASAIWDISVSSKTLVK